MLRQVHINKIDQEMGKYQGLNIAVFDIINAENDPDQKGKYQLMQTAVFIVQSRKKQR